MTNPRTGFPDGYLIYLIEQIESGIRRPFEDLINAHGISIAGYTALTVLQFRPGISSSELARRTFVRAQTMAPTVNALIDAGLVRRERSTGRQLALHITDLGLELVAELAPDVSSLEARMTAQLADDEPAALILQLRSVRDALAEISREPRREPAAG
jgi:DNA-binding MarR family transcriptional regulator